MSKCLIFDPFAGASGDMTLAALLDIGLPEEWLRDFVASLGLGEIGMTITRANRRGIDCARLEFQLPHEHAHRHLRHVLEIIGKSNAPATAKERAGEAFRLIAVAEAAVHGMTVEKVHFHEVGALDAILDVLCTMAAVDELGFDAFYTRPVALGSGWIEIAHGRFPVPAPATLRILEGVPTTGLDLEGECTTPTGAAIIAALTGGRTPPVGLTLRRSGYGAGTRDPQSHPNCLRLVVAEVLDAHEGPVDSAGTGTEQGADAPGDVLVLQADIDDMAPEYLAAAQEAALAAGALDAVAVPVTMKKGRLGHRLDLIVTEATREAVTRALFQASSTIGVRFWRAGRETLHRVQETRVWRGQEIGFKRVTLPDGTSRAKPEYEDVARAASVLGLSAFEVRRALDEELPQKPPTGV